MMIPALISHELHQQLLDRKNNQNRTYGVEKLKRVLSEVDIKSVPCKSIEEFIHFLPGLLDDSNFKVMFSTLQVLNLLIQKLDTCANKYFKHIVLVALKTLGDARAITRNEYLNVFRQLMKTVPPQHVLDLVIGNLTHKNSRVREDVLNVIMVAILTHPRIEFDIPKLCLAVAPYLVDSKRKVRHSAFELFALFDHCLESGTKDSLINAVNMVKPNEDPGGLMAAVQARRARHTLPKLSSDGVLEYGLVLLIPRQRSSLHCVSEADLDWVMDGPRVSRARSHRTVPESDGLHSSLGSLTNVLPLPRRITSAGKGKNKLLWEKSSLSSTENEPQPCDTPNGKCSQQVESDDLIVQAREPGAYVPSFGSAEPLKSRRREVPLHLRRSGSLNLEPCQGRTQPLHLEQLDDQLPEGNQGREKICHSVQQMLSYSQEDEGPTTTEALTPTPPHQSSPPTVTPNKPKAGSRLRNSLSHGSPPSRCPTPDEFAHVTEDLTESLSKPPFPKPDMKLTESFNLMSSKHWKEKVKGLTILRSLAKYHPDVIENRLDDVCRFVIDEVKNTQSTVSRFAMCTLGDMYTHLQRAMDSKLDETAEQLLKKAGETIALIRQDADEALKCMVKHCTSTRCLNALLLGGLNDRYNRVRKSTAQHLFDLVTKIGANCIVSGAKDITEKLIPAIGKLAQDAQPEPRFFGRQMLLFLSDEPNFDEVLEKYLPTPDLATIKKTVNTLRTKGVCDEPQESQSARGRRSQPVKETHRGPSLNKEPVNKTNREFLDEPAYVTEDLTESFSEPAEYSPFPKPDMKLTESLNLISSKDWEEKVKGLTILRSLVKYHPDVIQNRLQDVRRAVIDEVKNTHNTVSRVAVCTLGDMYTHLQRAMDSKLDETVEQLLKKAGETNALTRQDADEALKCMVKHCTPTRCLNALLLGGLNDRNKLVRKSTAQHLFQLVTKIGAARIVSGAKDITEKLIPAVGKLAQDAQPEPRLFGRQMLLFLSDEPNFDKVLEKYLPTPDLTTIKKTVNTLRTKGVCDEPQESQSARGRRSQPGKQTHRGPSLNREPVNKTNKEPNSRYSGRSQTQNIADKSYYIKELLDQMGSKDFKDRMQGIDQIVDDSQNNPNVVISNIHPLFDAIRERLVESNSKVNLHALVSLPEIIIALEENLAQVVNTLVPAIVDNHLNSKNTYIYSAAISAIDALISNLDNTHLLQLFCNKAKFLNGKAKADLIEKVAAIVTNIYCQKPQVVKQRVLPLLWHLLGISTHSGSIHNLCEVLYNEMGSELAECAASQPINVRNTLNKILSTID